MPDEPVFVQAVASALRRLGGKGDTRPDGTCVVRLSQCSTSGEGAVPAYEAWDRLQKRTQGPTDAARGFPSSMSSGLHGACTTGTGKLTALSFTQLGELNCKLIALKQQRGAGSLTRREFDAAWYRITGQPRSCQSP